MSTDTELATSGEEIDTKEDLSNNVADQTEHEIQNMTQDPDEKPSSEILPQDNTKADVELVPSVGGKDVNFEVEMAATSQGEDMLAMEVGSPERKSSGSTTPGMASSKELQLSSGTSDNPMLSDNKFTPGNPGLGLLPSNVTSEMATAGSVEGETKMEVDLQERTGDNTAQTSGQEQQDKVTTSDANLHSKYPATLSLLNASTESHSTNDGVTSDEQTKWIRYLGGLSRPGKLKSKPSKRLSLKRSPMSKHVTSVKKSPVGSAPQTKIEKETLNELVPAKSSDGGNQQDFQVEQNGETSTHPAGSKPSTQVVCERPGSTGNPAEGIGAGNQGQSNVSETKPKDSILQKELEKEQDKNNKKVVTDVTCSSRSRNVTPTFSSDTQTGSSESVRMVDGMNDKKPSARSRSSARHADISTSSTNDEQLPERRTGPAMRVRTSVQYREPLTSSTSTSCEQSTESITNDDMLRPLLRSSSDAVDMFSHDSCESSDSALTEDTAEIFAEFVNDSNTNRITVEQAVSPCDFIVHSSDGTTVTDGDAPLVNASTEDSEMPPDTTASNDIEESTEIAATPADRNETAPEEIKTGKGAEFLNAEEEFQASDEEDKDTDGESSHTNHEHIMVAKKGLHDYLGDLYNDPRWTDHSNDDTEGSVTKAERILRPRATKDKKLDFKSKGPGPSSAVGQRGKKGRAKITRNNTSGETSGPSDHRSTSTADHDEDWLPDLCEENPETKCTSQNKVQAKPGKRSRSKPKTVQKKKNFWKNCRRVEFGSKSAGSVEGTVGTSMGVTTAERNLTFFNSSTTLLKKDRPQTRQPIIETQTKDSEADSQEDVLPTHTEASETQDGASREAEKNLDESESEEEATTATEGAEVRNSDTKNEAEAIETTDSPDVIDVQATESGSQGDQVAVQTEANIEGAGQTTTVETPTSENKPPPQIEAEDERKSEDVSLNDEPREILNRDAPITESKEVEDITRKAETTQTNSVPRVAQLQSDTTDDASKEEDTPPGTRREALENDDVTRCVDAATETEDELTGSSEITPEEVVIIKQESRDVLDRAYMCVEHGQPLTVFCESEGCNKIICCMCVVKDHLKPHSVIPLEQRIEEVAKKVAKPMGDICNLRQQLEKMHKGLNQQHYKVEMIRDSFVGELKTRVHDLTNLIQPQAMDKYIEHAHRLYAPHLQKRLDRLLAAMQDVQGCDTELARLETRLRVLARKGRVTEAKVLAMRKHSETLKTLEDLKERVEKLPQPNPNMFEEVWFQAGIGLVMRDLFDEIVDLILDLCMQHLNPWFTRPRNDRDRFLTDASFVLDRGISRVTEVRNFCRLRLGTTTHAPHEELGTHVRPRRTSTRRGGRRAAPTATQSRPGPEDNTN